MTKKYGGYTAAELREGIARDDDFHAGVVRDLLDALSAPQAPVTDAARAEPVAFGPAVNMPWTPEQEKALDAALDRVFEKPEAPTQQPARASEAGEAHCVAQLDFGYGRLVVQECALNEIPAIAIFPSVYRGVVGAPADAGAIKKIDPVPTVVLRPCETTGAPCPASVAAGTR